MCYFVLAKIDGYSIQRLGRVFRKFLHLLLLILLKVLLSQNFLFGSSGSGSNNKAKTTEQSEWVSNGTDWINSMNAIGCNYDFERLKEDVEAKELIKHNSQLGVKRTFLIRVVEDCEPVVEV